MTTQSTISPISARSASESIRSAPAALRSEWIKITSLRSYAAIAVLMAALSGFAGWAIARFVDDDAITSTGVFSVTTVVTAVFAAVAGILIFSTEAQHGTLAGTLTAQPSKTVITATKAVIAAGYGAFLAAVAMATAIAGSQLAGVPFGETSTMAGDAGRAMLFTAIASVFGLGIGMIARHSAIAISGLLAWWLLGETLITGFADARYSRLLPFNAGNALIGVTSGPEETQDAALDAALTALEGGLVFGGYTAAALALGTLLLHKLEAS